MKKIQITGLAALVVLAASCGRRVDTKSAPKTSMDSFSYIVGNQVGNYMKMQGVDKLNYGTLIKGIEDALTKDSGFAIKPEDMERVQSSYVMKEQEKKIKLLQDESKKWMADNAKNKGVSYLPSKGQFKMLKQGSGPTPGVYDTIEYSMVVKDIKGKVKGDTRKQGMNPKDVVNKVPIAPVQEAFQKVTEGSTFEVYIQNDVYMRVGSQGSLEDRFGITIFTIELLKVTPGKAPAPGSEPKQEELQMPEGMQ
jgi:FKBP-type peptidyl-prolyl cis-trans isomerase FklB